MAVNPFQQSNPFSTTRNPFQTSNPFQASSPFGATTQRSSDRGLGQAEQLVQEKGLTEQFEQKLPAQGEQPNEFLSGGFIMDTFDWLNSLQYGVTGVLKGKGFIEGVKSRESWADEDALGSKGLTGTIAGIALDIATDPLTYIAPVTVLSKLGKATKLTPQLKKAQSAFVKTKAGQKLGNAFVYRFGQDPLYKEMAERTIKNQGQQVNAIVDVAQPLIKQDKAVREMLTKTDDAGKVIRRTPEEINELMKSGKVSKEAVESYKEIGRIIDSKTNEMVKLGLLPDDVYKNINQYVNNQYLEFATKKSNQFVTGSSKGLDSSIFKKRKDIPEEVREQLGQIFDAGYLLPETAIKMTRTVENAKLFNEVARKWGVEEAAEGLVKMPETRKWGSLSGKYVPDWIHRDLIETIERPVSEFGKITRPIVSTFKYGKVILNPATHARNIMSNMVLNSFEGMRFSNPQTYKAYAKAAKELKTKGEIYKEARKAGLGINTFASAEIKDIISSNTKLSKSAKDAMNKVADLYEKEEQFAKMAQYIFQRNKGLSPEDAYKVAERATFNYAQVTPFIRKLRESIFGMPFITFSYKATPQVARTALTKPTAISNIGKVAGGIEEMTPESERERVRATEAPWVRDGFYVQLPIKDKEDRYMLLDLTYMLPFGDLVTGQLFTRGINSETGFKEGAVSTATQKSPFLNVIVELSNNQDFYGNKIYKESDSVEKQTADVGRHVLKLMTPPLISEAIPGGYRPNGEQKSGSVERFIDKQRGIDAGGKQSRTTTQEIFRNFGLKVNPIDIQTQEYWADKMKEKAANTFLKESGEAKGFEILYD